MICKNLKSYKRMKTFIIYNEEYPKSKANAEDCLKSFDKFSGWDVQMYNGCWPDRISEYESKYGIYDGERTKFKEGAVRQSLREHKHSCFFSHYSLWVMCYTLNEPIVIIENDTTCIADFNVEFDYDQVALIQLTAESMLNKKTSNQVSSNYRENLEGYNQRGEGIHEVFFKHPHGKTYMAGNTGYIITPNAAEYIIEDCKHHGWTQNDLLLSSDFISLYYVNPSPIRYDKRKELKSSSRGTKG